MKLLRLSIVPAVTLLFSLFNASLHAESNDSVSIDGGAKAIPIRVGDRISLGNGRISAIQATDAKGRPYLIGVEFSKKTLTNLPTEHSDGLNCWDSNGDDAIDLDECDGGHERVLYLEKNASPFQLVVINWESHGHVPDEVYDIPHFDFHFYMTDNIARHQIAVGPCPGVMNCAQTEIAIKPLPSGYIHPDFFNTKLAYARMGNHWADKTSPEFNGGNFTHTFIQGSYDGRLTFLEPMVSLPYLQSEPSQCSVIKQPLMFERAGYYPTRYCIRYYKSAETYRVTLESFVYREGFPY